LDRHHHHERTRGPKRSHGSVDWQRNDRLGRRRGGGFSQHRREILRGAAGADADANCNCDTDVDAHTQRNTKCYSHGYAYCDADSDTYDTADAYTAGTPDPSAKTLGLKPNDEIRMPNDELNANDV
jgi:hypothetical protein